MAESSKEAEPALVVPIDKLSMAEFLESCPPNQDTEVSDIAPLASDGLSRFATPEIQLHCTDDACNGLRFFRCTEGDGEWATTAVSYLFLTYTCANCQRITKTFSVALLRNGDRGSSDGRALKIGEIPPFGPPTPARLIKLVGPDRELFLQGRRCENQGLGIGALVYYRRVVENQKNRILSEILKVANMVGASAEAIAELEAALKETQFTKALETVKHGIPQALMIRGHNPLLLLHNALSNGVHGRTDEECLELATHVRVILAELEHF